MGLFLGSMVLENKHKVDSEGIRACKTGARAEHSLSEVHMA